jgi:SNF2 family DNA or RNA helicase
VAVRHGLDESIVLRNLGFKAPSPITYQYDWPRNELRVKQPFNAQKKTAEFLTMNPRSFVLSEIGTGKTMSTLWAADYLMTNKHVQKVLIVSTLSTLQRVWLDEINEHFPHRTAVVLHDTAAKRKKLLEEDVDFYIINHDGLSLIAPELLKRLDINLIVVDEIASFRNAQTKRWKTLNSITNNRRWVWGLTGTPSPNSPVDAYGQCKLISPQRVSRYFGAFKDAVMRQVGPFKWVPRDNAAEIVHNAMQPAIRYTRAEIMDLPDCMFETRHVELSPVQKVAYSTMLRDLAANIGGNTVIAANDAVAAGKLLQVACGVVYANNHEQIQIPSIDRVKETVEIIEQSHAKVIVFAPFRSVVEWLAEELNKHFPTEFVHGGTSATARNRIFSRFQHEKDFKVIVAHPGAMAHGLTLTEANTIVWFCPIYSNEIYEQANGRINRPGQKNNMLVVHIEGTELERRIYKRLSSRQRLQGLLLDMVKQET